MAIMISIHNSDLADLFVTVLDLNLSGTPIIVQNQPLNEDQTLQAAVQENGEGNGNIQWNVQRADDPSQTAQRTVEVTNADTVDVTTHFG